MRASWVWGVGARALRSWTLAPRPWTLVSSGHGDPPRRPPGRSRRAADGRADRGVARALGPGQVRLPAQPGRTLPELADRPRHRRAGRLSRRRARARETGRL